MSLGLGVVLAPLFVLIKKGVVYIVMCKVLLSLFGVEVYIVSFNGNCFILVGGYLVPMKSSQQLEGFDDPPLFDLRAEERLSLHDLDLCL